MGNCFTIKQALTEKLEFANNLFVAVGIIGVTDAFIVTSTDGITWTEQVNPKNKTLKSITWTGTWYVAMGANYMVISQDGVTWKEIIYPGGIEIESVHYNNDGLVCACGVNGTNGAFVDAQLLRALNFKSFQ